MPKPPPSPSSPPSGCSPVRAPRLPEPPPTPPRTAAAGMRVTPSRSYGSPKTRPTVSESRSEATRSVSAMPPSKGRAPGGRKHSLTTLQGMPHFDVVVLGAGPGGYVAAIRAAQLGKSVAVVESKYWGGVCLNVGCIPSKALLRNAELAHLVKDEAKTFGISGEVSFDYGVAFDRSRTVADGRVKGVHFLMKKNKITEFDGWGEFTDPHTLRVALNGGGEETVTFDNVIIATGTNTRLLPGTTLSDRVVTYEEQITTRELPGSVIIAGAGAIGVEFAYVLRNYGVQVTIVEFLDRMLPLEDEAVSKELAKAYRKLGVDVLTSTKVEKIDDSGDSVVVTVSDAKGSRELTADKVIQAIGFSPRVEGYGLDKLGVQLTDRGAIAIDDHMRTNVPHVYAIGDVTAK